MSTRFILTLVCLIKWSFAAGSAADESVLVDDFTTGSRGWVAGWTDYPVGEEAFYELEAEHRMLPANLGSDTAWFVSGNNHSDDLFMYLKKQLSGLQPNTEYNLVFDVQFATSARLGSIGIGGSPAESVWLKVGANSIEPNRVVDESGAFYRMNIDKGVQNGGGKDAVQIGNIGKPDDGNDEFVLVSHNSEGFPFSAMTDSDGSLWLMVGTDSGFEGVTSLYYTRISTTLTAVPEPNTEVLFIIAIAAFVCGRRRRVHNSN